MTTKVLRSVARRFFAGASLILFAGSNVKGATAMSTNDPMAAVRNYIDAFNRGDAKQMAATFSVPASILDGMAPHVWQGPTAAQDWYRDVLMEGKQHGASDYFVTLGEPLHNNVTGDSAYVVDSRDHDIQSERQARSRKPAPSLRWRCASSPKAGASRPGPGRRANSNNDQ